MSVELDWQQARAAATIDRSGWGAGWSMGNSFVNVLGEKSVYPASGGSYLFDPNEPSGSGLKHYKLQDLKFTQCGGHPAAAAGCRSGVVFLRAGL